VTTTNTSEFSYRDPGGLQHCGDYASTIDVASFCNYGGEFERVDEDSGSATVTVRYLDPLTIPDNARALEASPGATVSFTTSFSGGRTPYATPTTTLRGATARISGTQVTYEYRIPLNAQAGEPLTDKVTISGAATSCGGDSAQIDVTINVLPGPSIDPDPLVLSGSPGATVSDTLEVLGGTGEYSWQANNGGSVNPTTGSSVTYSYSIPGSQVPGTITDSVTVTDANGATDTATVTISVAEIPPLPGLSVNPRALTLSGAAGSEVRGELGVSGGSGEFTHSADKGTTERSGDIVIYKYSIPPGSTGSISDVVTIRDNDPDAALVSVPVTIEVLPAIAVTPSPLTLSSLSLVGVEGEASGSFDVSGGSPPYTLSVASGGSGTVEPARLDTAGAAKYIVAIPASSAALVISDMVVITDSTGASVQLPVTVDVAASDSLSSRPDLSPNERSVARAIETLCPQLGKMTSRNAEQEDLFQQCSDMLGNSSSNAIPNTLEQVTTEKARAATSAAVETGNQQLANIGSRLAAVRGGATGLSLQGLTLNIDGQPVPAQLAADMLSSQLSGGAASGDSAFGRWGFFVNGSFNFGDKDTTENETGFDFSTAGITAGADYRFSDQLVAGGAIGFARNDTTFDSDGGGLDTETWHLAAYGTYGWSERGYVDAIVEYGWQSYDSTRNIRYQITSDTGAVSRQAKADYDGTQFGASIGAGYDFDQGPLSYGVYGRAGYVQVDVDGYRELGASGLDLRLDDFDATSVTTTLGTRVSRVFNTSWAVLVPQARAEWEHEYDQDADTLVARFAADPTGTAFGILSDSPDRDYFRLGVGLSAVFPHGLSAFINYDTVLDQKYWTDHLIDVGVRWELY
jgi:outer membrane autotransporter protein